MRLLLLNDLHREMHEYQPIKEGYDAVILAGDIDIRDRGVKWAKEAFDVPVIYVRGNHEGYNDHWVNNLARMKKEAHGSNVHVLENEELVLHGVRFLGCTGWSTFEVAGDRMGEAMYEAGQGRSLYQRGARDYAKITIRSYQKILPKDTAALARAHHRWLAQQLAIPFEKTTVVITHHAPTLQVLPEGRLVELLDATDANPWEHLLAQSNVWCHGHTHHPHVTTINDCLVVTNPRGYPGQQLVHHPRGTLVVPSALNPEVALPAWHPEGYPLRSSCRP